MTSASDTNTYFVVYTVEGDFLSVTEIIDTALATDPPVDAPTIAELRESIDRAIFEHDGEDRRPLIDRIIEIVTLGNVPACGES